MGSPEDRLARVRAHLSPQYVCPYAPRGVRSGACAFEHLSGRLDLRIAGLAQDARPDAACVFVAAVDSASFAEFLEQSRAALCRVWAACYMLGGLRLMAAKAEASASVQQTLDPAVTHRPYPTPLGVPMFIICVGPCYPERHPRYAPHDAVVLTRAVDVARVQAEQPGMIDRIRAAMLAGAGALYDAGDPVLSIS